MFGVVLRSEQTFLFGGDAQEDDRAFWSGRNFAKGLGDFEQARRAGGVIQSAVVNLIAGEFFVSAEMVPMGHVNNMLIGPLRSVDLRDDVLRLNGPEFVADREVD